MSIRKKLPKNTAEKLGYEAAKNEELEYFPKKDPALIEYIKDLSDYDRSVAICDWYHGYDMYVIPKIVKAFGETYY